MREREEKLKIGHSASGSRLDLAACKSPNAAHVQSMQRS